MVVVATSRSGWMWQYLPQAMLAIFVSYAIYRFFYPKRKMSKAGVAMGSATVVSGGTSQGSSIEKTPSMDEDSPKNGKKNKTKRRKNVKATPEKLPSPTKPRDAAVESSLAKLTAMGFSESSALAALTTTGDADKAAIWLLEHQEQELKPQLEAAPWVLWVDSADLRCVNNHKQWTISPVHELHTVHTRLLQYYYLQAVER